MQITMWHELVRYIGLTGFVSFTPCSLRTMHLSSSENQKQHGNVVFLVILLEAFKIIHPFFSHLQSTPEGYILEGPLIQKQPEKLLGKYGCNLQQSIIKLSHNTFRLSETLAVVCFLFYINGNVFRVLWDGMSTSIWWSTGYSLFLTKKKKNRILSLHAFIFPLNQRFCIAALKWSHNNYSLSIVFCFSKSMKNPKNSC